MQMSLLNALQREAMMELLREFIVFDVVADYLGQVGYSNAQGSLPNKKKANIFGQNIEGVFTNRRGELVIELDSITASIFKSVDLQREAVTLSDGESTEVPIESLGIKFPFGRILVYEIIQNGIESKPYMMELATDQYSRYEATIVEPLFEYTFKTKDVVKISNNSLNRTISVDSRGFKFEEGRRYCLAISPNASYLGDKFGIVQRKTSRITDLIFSTELKTDIRTATCFIGRDNSVSVSLLLKGKRLNLFPFYRFELHIDGSVYNSDENKDVFSLGALDGEIIIKPKSILAYPGEYDTTLIGYSDEYPNGVILWSKDTIRSRIKIIAI